MKHGVRVLNIEGGVVSDKLSDSSRLREREAAEWVAALDQFDLEAGEDPIGSLSDSDKKFDKWVNESLENRTSFLRNISAWQRAERLRALRSTSSAERPAVSKRLAASFGAIAALLVAVVSFAITFDRHQENGSVTFKTAIGEHAKVPLIDGSKLELNTDTELVAEVNEEIRRVTIVKGEVYFDIAHDEGRPFVVDAGDKKVTVLGTKFTVTRYGDEVEVLVAEGKVKVDEGDGRFQDQPIVIDAGGALWAEANSTLLAEKSIDEVNAALGWRQGLLIFDQMDLRNVAEEFNRYNHVQIRIADEEAAKIRIGGSFRAENADAFARLLKEGFGLRVEREYVNGTKIIVIKS